MLASWSEYAARALMPAVRGNNWRADNNTARGTMRYVILPEVLLYNSLR